MEHKTIYEMHLEAIKDTRRTAGNLRYSPWALALSVSLAWGLLVGATVGAHETAGAGWAFVTGLLILPFPVLVTSWVRKAFALEGQRLEVGRALLVMPEPPPAVEDAEPEPAGPVELTAGYDYNGQIVAPMRELTPEAAALRLVCLRFVRAGQHRGGWSRSKIAEGPRKIISGDDWSTASKELQRLNLFAVGKGGALAPTRDVADVLARLEAAR
jgi:hypothetical protein